MDIRFYSNCIQKSALNYDFMESLRGEMMKKSEVQKKAWQNISTGTVGIMTTKRGPIH